MRFAEPLPHALVNLLKDEAGASLSEYALIGSLVLVVCLLALLAFAKEA